jgi:hypothetical protein
MRYLFPVALTTTIASLRTDFILVNDCTMYESQSYQTMISSIFEFLLLSLAILKYRQYFLMLQTLKLSIQKQKKSLFYKEKSLVELTPGFPGYSL